MLDKLEAIYSRYCEIEQQMNDPAVTGDMKRYVKLSKDYKDPLRRICDPTLLDIRIFNPQ